MPLKHPLSLALSVSLPPVTQSFTLPYRRLAVGSASETSNSPEHPDVLQNGILPSSKVNAAPLPIRWGEGIELLRLAIPDGRTCPTPRSFPSLHRMGRGLGRGALQLSATAFFRRQRAADWLRYSRVKLCATSGSAFRFMVLQRVKKACCNGKFMLLRDMPLPRLEESGL